MLWLRRLLCRHKWLASPAAYCETLGAWIIQERCAKCGKTRWRVQV